MTIHRTDVRISSDVTSHRATRCPGRWTVTWLGDRIVDYDLAVTAMMVADFVNEPLLSQAGPMSGLVDKLGMSIAEAVRLIADSEPAVRDAIPADDKPSMPRGEVIELPDGRIVDAAAWARIETILRDNQSVSALRIEADEPAPLAVDEKYKPGEVYADHWGGRWIAAPTDNGVRLYGFAEDDTHDPAVIEGDVGPLIKVGPAKAADHTLPPRPTAGEPEPVDAEPGLRLALSRLLDNWKQQQRWHGQDAERFASDPMLTVAYRDLCTKSAVYERVIAELTQALSPTTDPCAAATNHDVENPTQQEMDDDRAVATGGDR